jgi:chromate transporter
MQRDFRRLQENAMEVANASPVPTQPSTAHLLEVAQLFARLGFTAFGGPAAHIAMMREEVVRRRGWLSDERFMDMIGVANLIPGPSSTELAIYLGYVRAGWPGLLVAGVCFIGPAMLIVLALAWAYVRFGHLPAVGWLFYGVQPVIVAIIAQAIWNLRRIAIKAPLALVLAATVIVLYLLNTNVLFLLFGGALTYAVVRWVAGRRVAGKGTSALTGFVAVLRGGIAGWRTLLAGSGAAVTVSYLTLFLTFLKLGAVIYGSGYVLLAFLRADLVNNLHWLTDRQLLDAISIGQFTPGPVFTTATFIGYVIGSWPGALLATLGIFLPSFVLIALVHPIAARLRHSPWTFALLDGVNAAALALMTGVLLQLGAHAIVDPLTAAIAVVAFAILVRTRTNSLWLIVAGALIGVVRFRLL